VVESECRNPPLTELTAATTVFFVIEAHIVNLIIFPFYLN
jgi:hypothetical protein